MKHQKTKIQLVCILTLLAFFSLSLWGQEGGSKEAEDIVDLSLDDLLNIEITSASKFKESISDTPATLLVITKKDIADRGYTNLPQIFADLPGMDVIVSHGDVHQLVYARGNRTGSMNERTMFMVDGVEQNMLYTQHMNIDTDFPLTAIERIEVLYGPASAVYGPNAFSGIINIITRNPQDLEDKTDKIITRVGVGSFDTKFGDVTFLGKHGPLGISLSYKRYRSDRIDLSDRPGFFTNGSIIGNPAVWGPFAQDYPLFQNLANNYGIIGKLTFKNFQVGFNRLLTNQGNGGVYPFDKTLPTVNWKLFRNIFHIRYQRELSEKITWSFLSTFQKGGAGPDSVWAQGWNDGLQWTDIRTVEMMTWKFISSKWALFQDLVFKPADNWILSGGFKYAAGKYQKSYEFGTADTVTFIPGDTDFSYDNLYPQPLNPGQTPGNTFNDSEWGVYIQSKWSTRDKKFNLVAGMRYDDNNIYGDTFNPRIGATYQLSKKFLLKANYGTAFQAPAPRNLGGSWGGLNVSTELQPDEIETVDLSILSTSKNFAHDLTLFHNVVTKSILQGENLPKKTMMGFEYKFNLFFQSLGKNIKNIRAHFNYTFIDAKYDTERINLDTLRMSDKVGGIAKNKFNFILDADLFKHIHFNFKLNYIGKRPTIVSNPIAQVDAFTIASAGLQFRNIFKHLTLFVNVYNLFDVEYYHPGYDSANAGEDTSKPSTGWYCSRMPQPRRNFILGMTIEF